VKEKPDCEACRVIKARSGEEPNCDECLPPLDERNKDVYTVYSLVCNQMIVTAGGDLLDVNLVGVEAGMRMLDIEDYRQKEVMRRVVSVIRSNLKGYREQKAVSDIAMKSKASGGTRHR